MKTNKCVKKEMTTAQKKEAIWGLLFISPTILGLLLLNFYPAISTMYQSLCKTGDFGRGNVFVGLANYSAVLSSKETWQALFNTIKYTLIEVPFGVSISMILAVFLQGKIVGKSIFRTIFFLPMVCAPAAVAMVWKWLFNQTVE